MNTSTQSRLSAVRSTLGRTVVLKPTAQELLPYNLQPNLALQSLTGGWLDRVLLHWLRQPALLALQPVDWTGVNGSGAKHSKQCRRTTLAATKPMGPLRPRRLPGAHRDQETAVVEVLPHGWLSAAVRIAELLWATAELLQGGDHRDRLWQDQRGPSRPAIEDKSNVGPSASIPRSNGASPSAGTAKRKSSNSATRGESELRKQFLHVSNLMRWTRGRSTSSQWSNVWNGNWFGNVFQLQLRHVSTICLHWGI